MEQAETLDFPFVVALPKREKSRVVSFWESFDELRKASKQHGFLMPVKFAADLANVSRQRIDELVADGVIERVEVQGHPFITENSFVAWAQRERQRGRPVKQSLGMRLRKLPI
jgi:hypothetical protein